ncbi:ER membrane protein complex subunit 1 [Galleria mellonella]|uniref:ER membrane protein complex subunit 1 n=1 Tax=Galleria mellonella TaxID=7137 RepID=A0ABM3MT74_GALME|nr:ER membrane protein complex subunit 1 [Galleria mellonella]
MGVLSNNFKPNFLGLLKFLNSINFFIVFFSLINLSVCIYEDQIGKFDWRQTYVGRIKFSQFDTVSTAKKIIVATEENVLAALNLKTGQVVWRHVLESASTGNFQLLHVTEKVVTVSGANPYLVRGWDSATGVLLWEWSLTLQNDDHADFSEWWVQHNMLVHMVPIYGSHIEVTMYNLITGQNRGSTSKLPAVWTNDGCVLTAPYYTCVGKDLIYSLDVTSNAVQLISKPLSKYITNAGEEVSLRPLDANSILPGFIVNDKKIVIVKNNDFQLLDVSLGDQAASATIVDSSSGPLLLQTWSDETKGFFLTAHSVSTGQEVPEIQCSNKDLHIPEPEISAAMCSAARENHVCRVLVTGADDASHLMQQGGRLLWTREEALANVVAVEFVDLPVSDLDAAIESEFDQKEGSIWSAFSRRLQTQLQQLQALLQGLQGERSAGAEPEPLVRDYFNLHKIIVLVTDVGKIFGMDNLSGEILWRLYEPQLDADAAIIFTRRSARHPPHDAVLTVVGKHEETGNGLIINLNPIRGVTVGERRLHLDAPLLQVALLPRADADKLHALILLDVHEDVQVLPSSAAPLVQEMYMYVAEKETAKVQGYALRYDGVRVVAQQTWSLALGGGGGGGGTTRLVRALAAGGQAVAAGSVLADRSVLYKYLNPNLVLFLAQGTDPVHKDVVSAWAVDAVSGGVVAAQQSRRARLPAAAPALLAGHFLAYVYYSDKHRRHEIATMELYEGKERWLPAGAAFSSLACERAPSVQRQAYILPAAPLAAAVTVTERALADIHVLLALSSGAVVEVPWALLSPRRAGAVSQPEEGLAPYAPELPLAADAVLSYNRTLHRPRTLHAAPSGLESTSLVLAAGLDLFYTRVAPSKTFDLLKDDFDYNLITIVLAALIVLTYSTKYLASRKMLRMAWK